MATIEERIRPTGKKFRVKIRLRGYPEQCATFDRLTDARKWAQQTETALREGKYFKTSEAKRHTAAELIDRYLEHVLPKKPRSEYSQKQQLLWWRSQFALLSLADITPSLIAQCRDTLLQGQTPRGGSRSSATVNRYLAALSHVFTIAVKEWGWVDENPLSKVTKLKEPRGRVRFLSEEERDRLLAVCKSHENPLLYIAIVLALSTGARRMEILGLKWKDVDLNRGIITLHETKNGERRILPLVSHAMDLMKEHSKVRRIDTELVFPGLNPKNPIDLRSAWETSLRKAEIEDFRFHDLRHSAASYLVMNGASMSEIAEVLGHKTLQMVKRYAHLSEAHTSKVVARMNEKIFGGV